MPILDIQRRVHEIGRIRIGEQAGDHPRALTTFRFTSMRADLIERAAAIFGGEPRPWNNQHEVITQADTLNVLVPPADVSFSQWWETWSAGGCSRRCDGKWEVIQDQPCVCIESGNRICDPITRLSLILPDFEVFGVWRLETGSWYAAGELASAVQLALQLADMTGTLAPAVVRIERRAVKRPNEPPRRFSVPVLDVQLSPVLGDRRTPEMPENANARQTLRPNGPESLSAAGLPAPAPRLARGEPSPAPTANFTDHDNDTPPTLTMPHVVLDEERLKFTPVEEVPPQDAEQLALEKLRRGCFAQVRDVLKTYPDIGVESDTLRHALAVLETAKRRDTPVTSWNDLDRTELSGVASRLTEIKRGQLHIAPDAAGGGVVFVTMSGRQAHVFMEDDGTWTWQLTEPKKEGTNDGKA